MRVIESILYKSYLLRQINSIVDMTSPREKLHPQEIGKKESSSNTPRVGRKRRRRIRPEQGSLFDILRAHCGIPLYVLPICWTDLHTRLLGVNFIQLDPVLTPVPGPAVGYMRQPTRTAEGLQRELNILLAPESGRPFTKQRALKNVLATLYPETMSQPKSSVELNIYFGGRVFRTAIRVPVIWRGPEPDNYSFDSAATRPASSFGRIPSGARDGSGGTPPATQPIVGYVNRDQLASIRQGLYRVVPGPENGDRRNTPVTRLQQLRSKMLVPSNVDEDPHFVGMILAMAQANFYVENSRSSSQVSTRSGISLTDEESQPTFRDIKIHLMTVSDDTAEFIVYTAVVSATFLRRFARPAEAPAPSPASATPSSPTSQPSPPADGGLNITYAKVPVWPILGLKERLGKALGREVAGDMAAFDESDPETIEMWETPSERRKRLGLLKNLKRRREREALIEVLNSSFEADEDDGDGDVLGVAGTGIGSDDSPVFSPSAKRRCTRRIHSLEVC